MIQEYQLSIHRDLYELLEFLGFCVNSVVVHFSGETESPRSSKKASCIGIYSFSFLYRKTVRGPLTKMETSSAYMTMRHPFDGIRMLLT